MQKTKSLLVVLAMTLMAAGLLVFAQMGPGPGGPGGGRFGALVGPGGPGPVDGHVRPFGVLARYLELSDEQVEQIRGILEQTRANVEPLRVQIREYRHQIGEALQSGAADPTEVGTWVIEIHNLRVQIHDLHESAREAIYGVLTAEQVEKLETLKEAAKLVPVLRAARMLPWFRPLPPEEGEGGSDLP